MQGDGDLAVRLVAHLAGEQRLVTEPAVQEALQLADGDAGLGDVHLQGVGLVGAHALGIGERITVGRRADGGDTAHQVLGQGLAGGAPGGEVGRGGEGLDHQAVVLARLPGHDPDTAGQDQAEDDGQQLQADAQPVAEVSERRMAAAQGAVLKQVLALQLGQGALGGGQVALSAQEAVQALVRRAAVLPGEGERHGRQAVAGDAGPLEGRGLLSVFLLSHASPDAPGLKVFQPGLPVKPGGGEPDGLRRV